MRLGNLQLAILWEHMRLAHCTPTFHIGHKLEHIVSSSKFNSSIKRLRALGLIKPIVGEIAHEMTPKGLFEYLRNGGRTMDHEGQNFFQDFLKRNPDFLGRYGEEESEYIEKCLILGFAPRFSKKASPSGT